MYNTVLGAKPLQTDGSTFYYSDYNFKASTKGLIRSSLGLLLRHIAAGRGRLPDQRLFARYAWRARKSLHSLNVAVDAGWR